MNKYQKWLNKKSKGLYNEQELHYDEHISYRQIRYRWNYHLQYVKHYQIMLVGMGIVRRNYETRFKKRN